MFICSNSCPYTFYLFKSLPSDFLALPENEESLKSSNVIEVEHGWNQPHVLEETAADIENNDEGVLPVELLDSMDDEDLDYSDYYGGNHVPEITYVETNSEIAGTTTATIVMDSTTDSESQSVSQTMSVVTTIQATTEDTRVTEIPITITNASDSYSEIPTVSTVNRNGTGINENTTAADLHP